MYFTLKGCVKLTPAAGPHRGQVGGINAREKYRLLLHLFPFYKLDSDRPVGEEQGIVDLVHALPDRILEAEAAEDGGKQHVQVLLGESVSQDQ